MQSSDVYLKKYYDKLKSKLIIEKKPKHKSLFISLLLDSKSNVRYRLLKQSTIPKYEIPTEIFNDLLKNRYISNIENLEDYALTAKGIWEYEISNKLITLDELLDYIDNKQITDLFSEADLTDKEKLLLFILIATRSFSYESLIDLKKGESTLNALDDIIDESYDKLKQLKIINKSKNSIYPKSENEHPIYNFIRHSDKLPRKTKGLFVSTGNQGYYLNLYKNKVFSSEDLSYLFWIILRSNPNLSLIDIDELSIFFNELSYDKSVYIYDLNQHIFTTPKYDDILSESIKSALIMINQ